MTDFLSKNGFNSGKASASADPAQPGVADAHATAQPMDPLNSRFGFHLDDNVQVAPSGAAASITAKFEGVIRQCFRTRPGDPSKKRKYTVHFHAAAPVVATIHGGRLPVLHDEKPDEAPVGTAQFEIVFHGEIEGTGVGKDETSKDSLPPGIPGTKTVPVGKKNIFFTVELNDATLYVWSFSVHGVCTSSAQNSDKDNRTVTATSEIEALSTKNHAITLEKVTIEPDVVPCTVEEQEQKGVTAKHDDDGEKKHQMRARKGRSMRG